MMDYDEIERMRDRRRRQSTYERRDGNFSKVSRRESETSWDNEELNIIEFDDLESRRSKKRKKKDDSRPELDAITVNRRPDRYVPESQKFRSQRNPQQRNPKRKRPVENKKRRKQKKKKHRFLLLEFFVLFLVLTGAYFVFRYTQKETGLWTIAVFGVDSRNGKLEKGTLSDVEMLCVVDKGTGEIKLLSVYRDTYVEINPDGTYHKINEAYLKGGHEQAIETLERNLDVSIDDYATFNWKAVVDAITILGGIDLEISDSEFRYINGFITETVESTGIGSHHLEHAGMNHLDGVQAVAYARLRLMDTDYNRTARQRLVIQLAMNKAKEADLKTLTMLVQAVVPQLSTSISVNDVLPMIKNISKYHISETGGFPFSRGEALIGKKDCVIPLTLESNVVQLHQFLYGTENFQPSATVQRISRKIAADSGMGEVAENAPEASCVGQRALEHSGGKSDSGGNVSESSTAAGQTVGAANQTQIGETEAKTVSKEALAETEAEISIPETFVEIETDATVPKTSGETLDKEHENEDSKETTETLKTESSEETQKDSRSESESSEVDREQEESGDSEGMEHGPGVSSGQTSGSGERKDSSEEAGGSSESESTTATPKTYDEKTVIETLEVGPGV